MSMPCRTDPDPVIDALERVIQLSQDGPQPTNELVVRCIRQAIDAYLSHGAGQPAPRRGLTLWQERRAKALLAEMADDEISIGDIAAACKLSRSYFSKAFKTATGCTPYRWLMLYRIEKAKTLLRGPLSISAIALECGFSDQSHLTRVFSGVTGMPPGAWRRTCDEPGEVAPPTAYRSQIGGVPTYS